MSAQLTAGQLKLKALLESRKQAAAQETIITAPTPAKLQITDAVQKLPDAEVPAQNVGIVFNEQQQKAVDLAKQGIGFCLIGAAGTGKTTTVKEIVRVLCDGNLPKMRVSTKNLSIDSPAIALVSFTNRAVKNIAKACMDLPAVFRHCLTIHSLLEFAPVWYEVPNGEGGTRKTMRFEPTYCAENPIHDLKLVVVDESSMCDTRLFKQLKDACPNATFIFLGDLNQLPPVFGDAILGFKLLELEVVELTQVYRQAMESPIIAFQHNYTLKGLIPAQTELERISSQNNGLTFHFMKKAETDAFTLNFNFARFFFQQYKDGLWNPDTDVILMPFNKGFGTIGLNQDIAQLLGQDRHAVVHHIVAGMDNKYFAEGDNVIHNKEEWEIINISTNGKYVGKLPNIASEHMNRRGAYTRGKEPAGFSHASKDFNLEEMLEELEKEGGTTLAASHCITLRSKEREDVEVTLESAGDVNSLDFSYAITIHKSQGSEWRKVYLIMTNYHSTMLSREILYTGMTRARQELYCIASPATGIGKKDGSFQRAIKKQKIPGIGWRQKAEAFKYGEKQKNHTQFMES